MAKGLEGTSLFGDANLVSYYKLEDVNDSKGSNTLTNNGTTPFNSARFDNGADLGASNSSKWLSRGDNLGIAGNGDMSISGWVKLQTEIGAGTYALYVHGSQLTADRYVLINYEYNGGTRRLASDASGTTGTYNTTLGTANYHHIVLTRNVGGNALKIYLDNSEVISTAIGASASGSGLFILGSSSVGGSNYASAIIDDVGVFSRVLTPTEVTTLFNSPLTSGTIPGDYSLFL